MDILEAVTVMMPCCACSNQYELTLKQVVLSHQMLHEGCPVTDERECPPLFWSHVVDEELARDSRNGGRDRAWFTIPTVGCNTLAVSI